MKPAQKNQSYRADIDGLRAVAIIPVLLFHARLGCSGGYVGVDIFFVISGFLISSLILNEIERSVFSLSNFWERRIRRILPAMTVMVTTTLIVGSLLYLPEDFALLGSSAAAQALLSSNIYFFTQPHGYFDASLDSTPLLHTWSLSVEEQFYLIFPLMLVFVSRFTSLKHYKILLPIAVGSFFVSIYQCETAQRAAFYLLPSRAWELLCGALLALGRGSYSTPRWLAEVTGWGGFCLICWSVFRFSEATAFPGLYAVVPCLGAVLIIFSSDSRLSTIGQILAWRPIVGIGLISYSLYLWHWPVLSCVQYLAGNSQWMVRAELLALTFALAIFSWKYIESPFRHKKVLNGQFKLFATAILFTVTLLIVGLSLTIYHGIPSRFSTTALQIANARNDYLFRNDITLEQAKQGEFVDLGTIEPADKITLLIWGDSHAMAVTPIIDDLCKRFSVRGKQATRHGEPPVLRQVGARPDSEAFASSVLDFIAHHQIKKVILTAHWKFYARDSTFNERLISTVKAIRKTGAAVFVLKDVPDQGLNVPIVAALMAQYHGDPNGLGITQDAHNAANSSTMAAFDAIAALGGSVVDIALPFLNSEGIYTAVLNDRSLYTDGNHLSVSGARILSPIIEPIFLSHR